jgi:sortase A
VLFSRILGGIGRTMIAAGVLILLFVVYQLWGTGIRTDSAQNQLGQEFNQKLTTTTVTSTTAPTTLPGEDAGATPSTRTVPATVPGTGVPATGEFPPPKPGDAIGQITIPKIGADFYMVEGVDLNYLSEGPGHFPGTPFPGQPGNAALAGHRTTWKAPFNRIDELAPGDEITIKTVQGTFTYQVIPPEGGDQSLGYKIISPLQTEILDQHDGVNTLTLMACHPKYSASQRIVVVAKLVGNPAPPTPKSVESSTASNNVSQEALFGGSGGDLVGGHPESQNAAIEWSILAGVIWLAAWLIARRWKSWKQWQRWTVYLVAFPIFLVPLFFAFENINRLLPAGY